MTLDEAIVKKQRCEKCEYRRTVYAYNGYSFYGCYCSPNKGRWVVEIKDCPKEGVKTE